MGIAKMKLINTLRIHGGSNMKNKVWEIIIESDYSMEAYPIGRVVVFAVSLEEAIKKIKKLYNSKNQFGKGKYWVREVLGKRSKNDY